MPNLNSSPQSRTAPEVALVFPPLVEGNFGLYYSSTAVLAGYLSARGIGSLQTDMNEDFATYQKELEQRVQVIESGLGSIGIRTAILNTQQLIELLYSVYNPEEAHKEKLIEEEELTGSIVRSELSRPEKPPIQEGEVNA